MPGEMERGNLDSEARAPLPAAFDFQEGAARAVPSYLVIRPIAQARGSRCWFEPLFSRFAHALVGGGCTNPPCDRPETAFRCAKYPKITIAKQRSPDNDPRTTNRAQECPL